MKLTSVVSIGRNRVSKYHMILESVTRCMQEYDREVSDSKELS